MRNVFFLTVWLVGMLLPQTVSAGHVTELVGRLGLEGIEQDTLLRMESICRTKDIVVNATADGFSHVGISLFSPEFKNIADRDICNFVERFLLEMMLCGSGEEGKSLPDRRKVKLFLNGSDYGSAAFGNLKELVGGLDSSSTFNICKEDGGYVVSIGFRDNELKFSFPSSRELISGKDKKEADMEVFRILKADVRGREAVSADLPDGFSEYAAGVLVGMGNSFMLDKLNGNVYYSEADSVPIWNVDMPEESLHNALLGLADMGIGLRVRHRMYGGFTPDLKIGLGDLVARFGPEFKKYAAVERMEDGRLRCVLLFHESRFDFIHMLVMSSSPASFFEVSPMVEADFFSNIPQNYLKSLF